MPYDLMSLEVTRNEGGLARREAPPAFRRLAASAPLYRASAALCEAINVALLLGSPLLITGEAGTGKTQAAWYAAHYFGLPEAAVFTLHVRSTTTTEDLTARFDAVEYFHAANDRARTAPLDRRAHVRLGPLARAWLHAGPAIVLVDEVDKAPRDFPNDLLHVLDQHEVVVPETGDVLQAPEKPPLVVITSNSERRLPEPFLRRCVFHHIELTPALVDRAVKAHAAAYARLSGEVVEAAKLRFHDVRDAGLRKAPSTAELLAWLATLSAMGVADAERLRSQPLSELPALSVLVKDSDDLGALRSR